ncbi:MAG: molybdopterin molybdenumtransferase MoeA [Rhodobacteraceae bacterium]|nr:molybdopterin molybdenumtransferase MoeA [Paracoccaceae bacterium]
MTPFNKVIIVDWSARSAPSPKRPSADAIWIAVHENGTDETTYLRTRHEAAAFLAAAFETAVARGQRVLAGFDFPFGYPAGFAQALTGRSDPFAIWDWLSENIEDAPSNANNRFEVAAKINAQFPGTGPFWGRPADRILTGLPDKGRARTGYDQPERRAIEECVPSAQPVWKLYTTGSVGSQALLGLPVLANLRRQFARDICVWPFDTPDRAIVMAEVYPSLLSDTVNAICAAEPEAIKDEVQVRVLARALSRLSPTDLATAFDAAPDVAKEEGWILGVGVESALRRAAAPDIAPPRLKNDCFALPPGVDWVPVDEALATLRAGLAPVVKTLSLPLSEAVGRVLAGDHIAVRSNPPRPNSAVDGYGFAHASTGDGPQVLPLVAGSAAAGRDGGPVPHGAAIRILTGAALPKGVDTVVLEEDTTLRDGHVAFEGPVKPGANARAAGEDVRKGDIVAPKGRRLRPPDLAALTAAGLGELTVFDRLRVGVLSTGDELLEPDDDAGARGIFDANRPMLLGLASGWGHSTRDLGIAPDDRDAVRGTLNAAVRTCDAILTSGGASAGDEDHISALLRSEGTVATWRIAVKPGRPLLLGLWQGVPVFGLPGNPVAAFVCALIFARPALGVLAGQDWPEPLGFDVPATFTKRKKAGRREYLRARLTPDGYAEAFKSEGSGRVSGISWATGLVELEDGARDIAPGDPVRFLPFGSFGV